MKIGRFIKNKLSTIQYRKAQLLFRDALSIFYSNNLSKLSEINGTDKGTSHQYTKNYAFYFQEFRKKKLNILEIGVGGYEIPNSGGESLRMWKFYFPQSHIFGLDLYDKKELEEKRIKIFKGSQEDKDFLLKVCNEIGEIDIIIDDGSHINQHVICTFNVLFPMLKAGGIYIIEDIQTAYWPDFDYGGDSINLNNPDTSINYFKKLIDGLNHEEFINPGYEPSYFDKNIKSLHFYHNMVFVFKGLNNEGSNFIRNNERIKS